MLYPFHRGENWHWERKTLAEVTQPGRRGGRSGIVSDDVNFPGILSAVLRDQQCYHPYFADG